MPGFVKTAAIDLTEELAIRALLESDRAREKQGAVYPGNLGAMEMFKFYRVATPAEKALMERLTKTDPPAAWELLKEVTGVPLKDPPWLHQGRTAKSNAKVIEVPNTFSLVVLQEPKATRKEFPFEGFIDFQGIKIDVENAKGSTRSGEGPEGPWSTFVRRVARRYMIAKGFDVPFSTSKVVVEPPQKKRKEYPFEGFIDFQGLHIHVENVKGSTREGVDPDGTPWKVTMKHHYGEVDQTKGVDHDPVDIYVGPNGDSPLVVVVRQQDPKTKKYDEDKVMVGFNTEDEAIAAYKAQYNSPDFYQSHKAMPIGRFLHWCLNRDNWGKRVSRFNGAVNAAKVMLSNLLAHLRALAWNHLTSHWQVGGDSSYGDHLLFEHMYSKTVTETDGLAEKLVGTFGQDAVDGPEQAKYMAFAMHGVAEIGCPFERALQMERVFQVMLAKSVSALEDIGQLSLGMDDMLRTMANDHETHLYLLQQRQGGVRMARVLGGLDPLKGFSIRYILHRVRIAATNGICLKPGKVQ